MLEGVPLKTEARFLENSGSQHSPAFAKIAPPRPRAQAVAQQPWRGAGLPGEVQAVKLQQDLHCHRHAAGRRVACEPSHCTLHWELTL